jgi:hypothetical protein
MFRGVITPFAKRSVLRQVRGSTARFQSTKPKGKNSSTIDFRTFISVSIFASILLTQVVDAVNQEKPRGQRGGMSEAEYYKQQQRLKRKIAMFSPDEKQVLLWKNGEISQIGNIEQLNEHGVAVIDPVKLVDLEKQDKESKFYDLLNDPELKELPRGLVVDLIGKFIKESKQEKFLVVGFPPDVKESIKFEDKIVTIKNLVITDQSDENDDVYRYYKTVNKSKKVDTIQEVTELFES